jgi:hypothetical protein
VQVFTPKWGRPWKEFGPVIDTLAAFPFVVPLPPCEKSPFTSF